MRRTTSKPKAQPKKAEPQNRRGRPSFEPTEHQRAYVAGMLRVGTVQSEAAKIIGVSDKTFAAAFRVEIDRAMPDLGVKAMNVLVQALNKGSVPAAIFILKTKFGFRERDPVTPPGDAETKQNEEARSFALRIKDALGDIEQTYKKPAGNGDNPS